MDYTQYAGPLLIIAGGAFQWARQFRAVREGWTYLFAAALASGVYALTYNYAAHVAPQEIIIKGLLWIAQNTATVLGGTFVASGMAKAGAAIVPLTNSK